MKRRTFLHLSSAALAALGLSACGAKTMVASSVPSHSPSDTNADVITDDIDADYVQVGLTLEEAKASSDKVFILRNGTFYSLPKPCRDRSYLRKSESAYGIIFDENFFRNSVSFHDRETDNTTLFDGDQLVYISSDEVPDTIEFAPVSQTGYTLPIIFEGSPEYGTFSAIDAVYYAFTNYDPNYIPPSEGLASHTLFPSDDLQINGQTLKEYTGSHQMVPIDYYDAWSLKQDTANYIVDLSDFVKLNESDFYNGNFTLEETNENNVAIISFYSGTDYYEFTVEATCIFYLFEPNSAISCNITKTKEGYAIIDTSNLLSSQNYILAYSPDCAPFSILSIDV